METFSEQFAKLVGGKPRKRVRRAKRPKHEHDVPAVPPVHVSMNTWALAA